MARPYRIQFEGATYRVNIRGMEDLSLFKRPSDANYFVEILTALVKKHEILLHAFVVLDNEADLLLETPKANISAFLQGLQTAYAQFFRRTYDHVGPIVRDRFRSKLVDKDALLLELSAFLHARAVRDSGKRRSPAQRRAALPKYRFSSLPAYLGTRDLPCVYTPDVLKAMKRPATTRSDRYLALVEARMEEPNADLLHVLEASPTAIGDPDFLEKIDQIQKKVHAGRKPAGVKLYGQKPRGMARTRILEAAAREFDVEKSIFFEQRKNVLYRPILSYLLYRHAGMSQDAIASYLRLTSGAAVSLQIRRLLNAMQEDEALGKRIDKLDQSLA